MDIPPETTNPPRSGGDSVTPHNENPGGEQSSPSAEVDRRDRGIYEKFVVRRTDRTDEIGSKHFGCEYFVLDLTHDKHAPAAILSYAESCQDEYPLLAQDLKASLMSGPGVGTNAPASTTGDFGADPASSSVPSGDSVTLIKTIRDGLDSEWKLGVGLVLSPEGEAARDALAVLELRESERSSGESSGESRCPDCERPREAPALLVSAGRRSGPGGTHCKHPFHKGRGLGSASAVEMEPGESLLETRARAIVEAHERVEKATREAFPSGKCSFDPEWIAATENLRNQLRLSALMVARAFLLASATKPEASPSYESEGDDQRPTE